MKKSFFTHSLLAMMALAATLVACKREVISDNPNYNAEDQTVTTQLVLNLATPSFQEGKTKQDAAATQFNGEAFRGIEEAFLLPIVQTTDGKILTADMDAESTIELSDILSASATAQHKSRVMEVQLPLKTNTLLFYAKAAQGDIASYDLTNDYPDMHMNVYDFYGKLDNYSIGKTKGSANFRLGIRMANTPTDATVVDRFEDAETLLSSIVTVIMNMGVQVNKGTHEKITNGAYTLVADPAATSGTTYPEFYWKDYNNNTGTSPVETTHALYPLEQKLRTLYKQMTTINNAAGELRAASGEAILRTMQDLWTVINEVRCATPLCNAEAVAIYFAQKVSDELSNYFTLSSPGLQDDGSEVKIAGFKGTNSIITMLSGTTGAIAYWWPAEGSALNPTSRMAALQGRIGNDNNILKDFPFNFNLPRGATHMIFTNGVLHYPAVFNTSSMGTAGEYGATNYYYPAELLYFGNGAIRVSDKDMRVADYPSADAWMTAGSWSADWKDGANGYVTSDTRAVAMQQEINYGTALLKTQVKYGATVLQDNRHAVMKVFSDNSTAITDATDSNGKYLDEPNNEIPVSEQPFELTGLIIGGQSQNVGWDYLPYYEVDNNGELTTKMVYGFVYDKAIAPAARVIPASGYSQSTYTMLFDNFKWSAQDANGYFTADTQPSVSIALEFKNNGNDFYGNHNIVKKGGYFYLIGSLNPTAGTGDIEFNRTDHVIPPYKADGTSLETKRVFIQDHVTSVTFSLNETSLQHAYLTTPDLRSSSLSLGLDVDLKWESGLTFTDIPLGE